MRPTTCRRARSPKRRSRRTASPTRRASALARDGDSSTRTSARRSTARSPTAAQARRSDHVALRAAVENVNRVTVNSRPAHGSLASRARSGQAHRRAVRITVTHARDRRPSARRDLPEGKTFEGVPGKSLLDNLLDQGIEVEHACEKSCACTTCHVIVREGFDSFAAVVRRRGPTCSIARGD
jgi:ferredoxin